MNIHLPKEENETIFFNNEYICIVENKGKGIKVKEGKNFVVE